MLQWYCIRLAAERATSLNVSVPALCLLRVLSSDFARSSSPYKVNADVLNMVIPSCQ